MFCKIKSQERDFGPKASFSKAANWSFHDRFNNCVSLWKNNLPNYPYPDKQLLLLHITWISTNCMSNQFTS